MLLVDTHVLLWLLADDSRLGPDTRRTMTTSTTYVSVISMLELTTKAMLGKLTMPADLSDRLADHGLRLLAFDAPHAAAITAFPSLSRHDPFDRALLGQAAAQRLRFLTADARLLALGLDWVADATR